MNIRLWNQKFSHRRRIPFLLQPAILNRCTDQYYLVYKLES